MVTMLEAEKQKYKNEHAEGDIFPHFVLVVREEYRYADD
jgi:hypothetical protein